MLPENTSKQQIISKLQKDILLLEGFSPPVGGQLESLQLGPLEAAFPNGIFPRGALHEFVSTGPEQAAATGGFIAGLLSSFMQQGSACVWISRSGTPFPPALAALGMAPEHVIFVDLRTEYDVLWATEEALRCTGLAAVVADIRELNFARSRRLQLAAEKSRVTALLLRKDSTALLPTACVARWQVRPMPSAAHEGLPGLGFPRWQVDLLKVKNGQTGSWLLERRANRFYPLPQAQAAEERLHTGKRAS